MQWTADYSPARDPPPPRRAKDLPRHDVPMSFNLLRTYTSSHHSFQTVQWLGLEADTRMQRILVGTLTSASKCGSNPDKRNYVIVSNLDPEGEDQPQVDFDAWNAEQTPISHEDDVIRAKFMPQDKKFLATTSDDGCLLVFDMTLHTNKDPGLCVRAPQYECVDGLQGRGDSTSYALAWSPKVQGRILSGTNGSVLCIWDIDYQSQLALGPPSIMVQPVMRFVDAHDGYIIEDVAWHNSDQNCFVSVGDDKCIRIWDTSTGVLRMNHVVEVAYDLHCLAFNPFDDYLFATAGADEMVCVWKLQNLSESPKIMYSLPGHVDGVFSLAWDPLCASRLACGGALGRINVWDISDSNVKQPVWSISGKFSSPAISVLSWSPNAPSMFATVDTTENLCIWQLPPVPHQRPLEVIPDTSGGGVAKKPKLDSKIKS